MYIVGLAPGVRLLCELGQTHQLAQCQHASYVPRLSVVALEDSHSC